MLASAGRLASLPERIAAHWRRAPGSTAAQARRMRRRRLSPGVHGEPHRVADPRHGPLPPTFRPILPPRQSPLPRIESTRS